mmetsp:Transcript_30040/g.41872  ORF Transcript_30040/g.41872 Transcript_30040/m.41872 type:complete len:189 (+) Transcript_30040:110-676(+)|eukprot:CAMPEP_0185272462 /NCGR_PEP_ID=MMETSP1359-20130426/47210_1 /TAXON_ID=552665 /ORGANISM="Bigelowiella longifila, Strain CCMP242" /LENGTH=188 /DNA_ID=CAMNT_0027864741 /DNA_START=224 /DNA_END=790 /DNA_ORIENTATION=+
MIQITDEIKEISAELPTTSTSNTQDRISPAAKVTSSKKEILSQRIQEHTHDIETCRRIRASINVQKAAIEQQIKVLCKKRDKDPHLFRQLSKLSIQREVLAISDDGFPRTPPRGTIFVHYNDGYIEAIANCSPLDKAKYEEKYGLERKGHFAQKRNEVAAESTAMTEVKLEAGNTTSRVKRNGRCIAS